jgi:hypothetical protein
VTSFDASIRSSAFGFDIEVKNFSWKKLKQGRDNYIKGITDWPYSLARSTAESPPEPAPIAIIS